jgi:HSP20 family molecular chaperone IbpA
MKGNRMYVDIGSMLDEVFEGLQDIGQKMGKEFSRGMGHEGPLGHEGGPRSWFEGSWDENTDYYPSFSYPPMNIYLIQDRTMVFEFALAGFDEKAISLTFQGDYMIFSARMNLEEVPEESVRYVKRRLKLKDVDKQKYYVPADKFAQEKVKAVFKNGILKVSVPPKEEAEQPEGIKIEILKDSEA